MIPRIVVPADVATHATTRTACETCGGKSSWFEPVRRYNAAGLSWLGHELRHCPDCPSPANLILPYHEPLDTDTTIEIAVKCGACKVWPGVSTDDLSRHLVELREGARAREIDPCPGCADGHRVVGTARVVGCWPVVEWKSGGCGPHMHHACLHPNGDVYLWPEINNITSQCHGLTAGGWAIEIEVTT